MRPVSLPRQFALLAAAALPLACEPDIDDPEADELAPEDEHPGLDGAPDRFAIELIPVFTWSGWTAWTSEEYPPVGCDPGSLVSQFGCSGKYCDNSRLYCVPTATSAGGSFWTAYFSEEGYDYRDCGGNYWMSALACKGSYCDNIAIQCTAYANTSPKNCYWTGWISEEGGGTLWFGNGYYARGVQCDGSYCDNKRFLVCQP